MYQYQCLNAISEAGLSLFSEDYQRTEEMAGADAVLLRSASLHETVFPEKLKVIARAGAGVNNIPLEECAEKGIVVFNTPGANANGVKELVIAGMLLASRDIIGGIEWVKAHAGEENIAKTAEKQKKMFAGQEIEGKKLGVIGLGAIGVLVANAALHLGMDVYGYDPYVSVDSAWNLSRHIHHVKNLETIYQECDYITLHVPALDDTKGMIDREAAGQMKDGVILLNFARDLLVKEEDLIEALETGHIRKYVTDFPTAGLAGRDHVIVIPHLGASTEESEDNCARMAVREIREYLENGNIMNSVNFPNCDMGKKGKNPRITVLHHNVPNMIGQFTALLAKRGINIADLTNKSRGRFAYTMIDIEDTDSSETHTESQINQSNYLRYLSELRKADSELALAKAESAELVRLMDSYKEHYCQYEKMIHTLVQGSTSAMNQQLKDNNEAVTQQLEAITALGRKLKKTSASLDSHIDAEIQRLTKSLAESIEGSIKDSCDKELAKVGEATQVLHDYSDKVKQQHRKFERLEGLKFGLFIFSSISSPIVLILLILNMLHII